MIYNSVDNIPAKIYFKIIETKDFSLLSEDKLTEEQIVKAWTNLEKEVEKVSQTPESLRDFKVSKKMELLVTKQEIVKFAVYGLRINKEDVELQDILKQYKYTDLSDLDKIDRENKNESIRISRLKSQLSKKEKGEEKEKDSLDDVIMGYAIITESGFIESNKLILGQFFSLIKLGNQKLKSLRDAN